MRPKVPANKPLASRRTVVAPSPPAPALAFTPKTSNVGARDLIRVLRVPGSGIFRDGMTVGEFVRSVPNRKEALVLLYRCRKSGLIGFEQGPEEA